MGKEQNRIPFCAALQWLSLFFLLGLMPQFSLQMLHRLKSAVNGSVHCFPGAVIGLKFRGLLSLNRTGIPGGHFVFRLEALSGRNI